MAFCHMISYFRWKNFSCPFLSLDTSLSLHIPLPPQKCEHQVVCSSSLACCHSLLGCMTSSYEAETHKSIIGLNHWTLPVIWTWLLKLIQYYSSSCILSLTPPCALQHNPCKHCWLLASLPHVSPLKFVSQLSTLSWKLFIVLSRRSMIWQCSGPFFVAAASTATFGIEPYSRLLINSIINNNNNIII